jgi:hypothetical protein
MGGDWVSGGMKILTVAAVVILLFVFSFFTERPEPREKTPEPTPSASEVVDRELFESGGHDFDPLYFYSENEFVEYVQEVQNEETGSFSAYGESEGYVDTLSRYYRLKNPIGEMRLRMITGTRYEVAVLYYAQEADSEHIMIRYSPYYNFDIETHGLWTERPFPKESYIRELDGVIYYIRKVDSRADPSAPLLLWSIEWYNADGYYMHSQFPYRFTAEEVLGYVSDLERVEIG